MQEDLHRLLQKAFEARLTAEAACQTHTKRIMDRYTEGPSDAFRGTLVWTRDIMAGGSPGVESGNSLVQNASLRLIWLGVYVLRVRSLWLSLPAQYSRPD